MNQPPPFFGIWGPKKCYDCCCGCSAGDVVELESYTIWLHFRLYYNMLCCSHVADLQEEIEEDGRARVEAEVLHRGQGRLATQEEREEVGERRVCKKREGGSRGRG